MDCSDEQQRRLFAGLESIRVGHGGDTLLGDFLGLDAHTVCSWRQQLARPGCGQPWDAPQRPEAACHEKKTPCIIEFFTVCWNTIPPATMTGLRWSRRSTTRIAEALLLLGISVSPNTIARLLQQMAIPWRVNHKQIHQL